MNSIHHRFDRLDLNLLTVFEAVFREQHLTSAAASLYLTPSAVSHALRRLRDTFGDQLFVRDGKVMRPTPACARIAPEIIEQLAKLRGTLQRWGTFNPAESQQTFTIALHEAAEIMVLPALLADISRQAPHVSVASVRADRRKLASSLASNNLHLAIDIALPIEPSIRHQPFLEDEFCAVMSTNNKNAKDLTVEAYLAASHIAVSTRATGLVLEEARLLNLGYARHISMRCQTYSTAVTVSEQSDSILTMPKTLAESFCQGRNLVLCNIPFHFSPVQLNLYWHINSELDPAISWFREICQANTPPSTPGFS